MPDFNIKKYVGKKRENPFTNINPNGYVDSPKMPKMPTLREVAMSVIDGSQVLKDIKFKKNSIAPGAGTIRDSRTGKILAEASSPHNAPGASVVKPKPKKHKKLRFTGDGPGMTISADDMAEMEGRMLNEEAEYSLFQKKYPSLLKSKYPSNKDMDRMTDAEVERWYLDDM